MKNLLFPGMFILNRMRYARKFAVVGSLMLLLVAVTLYFLLNLLNRDIVMAENERLGLQYNNAVQDVMIRMQEDRRVAVLAHSGDAETKGKLQAAHDQVDQAMGQVDAVELELDNRFQTQAAWAQIKEKWAEVKQQPPGSYEAHTALLADLLALVSRVGDQSQLILDPRPDSYYLMDATVIRLPALAEEIAQLREIGRGLISRQAVSNEERTMLIYKTASITSTFEAVNNGAKVVYEQNPSLQETLEQPVQQLGASFSALKNGLEDSYSTTKVTVGYEQAATRAVEAIGALYQTEARLLDQLLTERRDHYAGIEQFVIGFVLVVFLLVLYVFAAFYLSIMQAIRTLNESARQVAEGNLLARIPVSTADEMRDVAMAFNAMVASVNGIIHSSKQTADQVSATSDKLVSIAEQTSQVNQQLDLSMQDTVKGAEQQLSGTEESSHVINEMSIGVQRIADSTHAVSDLSQDATKAAAGGNRAMDEMIGQMATIQESVHRTAEDLQRLFEFSQQVQQIVEVIKSIADQTNLLALNSAIEAARVGEYGLGFTVVADETRQLAEQSARSAEEIAMLLEQMQTASLHSVQSMDGVIQNVQRGQAVLQESNELFQHILASSQEIAAQIQDISAASQQMAAGSEEAAASISEITIVTRNSFEQFQSISQMSSSQFAVMQELAEQAHRLNQMSQSLREQIGRFTL